MFQHPGRWTLGFVAAVAAALPPTAGAQEMVFTFTNPSFGGNPFYSDHLLGIANLDRPEQESQTPSPDDLLASQLRSQLTSSLSTSILTRIQTAKAGDNGTFTVGNQRISFTRTATETRVTFTNLTTGETSELVVPVISATSSPATFGASAEAALASGTLGSVTSLTGNASRSAGTEVSLSTPAPL